MMTERELKSFAQFIDAPLEDAREIVAQEVRDGAAHPGRMVRNGYDYDAQQWCECDYCQPESGT